MTKEEIKEKFNVTASNMQARMTNEIRGLLFYLKSTWDWDNNDLAFWLSVTPEHIELMLSEDWDGRMSSKTLSRIYCLCFNKITIPGCTDVTELEINRMRDHIMSYQTLKNRTNETFEDKTKKVLDLFGVTDNESIDRLIDTIIDVRETIDIVENENNALDKKHGTKTCECEDNKECCCKNDDSPKVCLSGSLYDSTRMDKPQTFNFSDIKTEDIQKYMGIISNLLKGLHF